MVIFKESSIHRRQILTKVYMMACLFLMSPVVVFAQAPQTFRDVVSLLVRILQILVPIILSLVLVWVLWSASQVILHADSPEKRREGKQTVFWGIIILFVMVSIWSLIAVLRNTFGV